MRLPLFFFALSFFGASSAVTIYGQIPFAQTHSISVSATGTATSGIASPTRSLLPAYDETILQPPPPPDNQPLAFTLKLEASNASVTGLSIMQHGSFFGFSIEIHEHRVKPYGVEEYANEFGSLVQAIQDNPNVPIKNMLIGPSLTSGPWLPDMLWPTGYLERFKDALKIIAMEHYPTNNCFARYGMGSFVDPQTTFPTFLNHTAGSSLIAQYLDTSARAQALGKPFIMFETNTATCGGLPGISDSFGAALWAVDYGLTMAAANFSGALLHVGGQNVYYNWTVGAIYYSVLVVAEVFGKSNVSQIIDTSNNGIYNPSYAVYDGGALSKVVFINFIDDPTGAHDITGTITVNGQVPPEVYVKYLLASSVSVKKNITWAGQTFGNKYEVDGLPKGDLNIVKIVCDQSVNQCHIPLKAPSLAVVFLEDPSSESGTTPAPTFATTAVTKTANTATVDPSVLATSNGHSGKDRIRLGSTSSGSIQVNWVEGQQALTPSISSLVALAFGKYECDWAIHNAAWILFWIFNRDVGRVAIGDNSSYLPLPFVNLLEQVQQRAGGVHIRIGGNTQDLAYHVESIDNGHATAQETPHLKKRIAEKAQNILGDRLLGLQAGNEPDLYLP
ncbi:hypothetical protein H0H87_000305 [Tephrocybe sp. NHM501043]|nr:hypothetical protein H0H87_000305 [Tephrocybe sp. NHM501043]